jgi:hypothetical protein
LHWEVLGRTGLAGEKAVPLKNYIVLVGGGNNQFDNPWIEPKRMYDLRCENGAAELQDLTSQSEA